MALIAPPEASLAWAWTATSYLTNGLLFSVRCDRPLSLLVRADVPYGGMHVQDPASTEQTLQGRTRRRLDVLPAGVERVLRDRRLFRRRPRGEPVAIPQHSSPTIYPVSLYRRHRGGHPGVQPVRACRRQIPQRPVDHGVYRAHHRRGVDVPSSSDNVPGEQRLATGG